MKQNKGMWHPAVSRTENIYVAFQTEIQATEDESEYEIRIHGSNAYRAYLNGTEIIQGPARFDRSHPEYDSSKISLRRGTYVFVAIVHYYGVSTRITAPEIPAFFQCELWNKQASIPLNWLCKELQAYVHSGRRLNGQLGWMEQCDVNLLPELNSIHVGIDWLVPVEVDLELGKYQPKRLADCHNLYKSGILLSQGSYSDRFGYRDDDPPVRFMLRDLNPLLPADGIWLRYDFERIGLYYPEIVIDVPKGSIVEAGYSETLTDGRVVPFITLSLSQSCSMDRWVTKRGLQDLKTFSPRGFRFLELHITAPLSQIGAAAVSAKQRTYFAAPNGSFRTNDKLLNDIWIMCVNTLQSCSEDALIDTPTRERGQWLGDAVAVGMETINVSFNDLSLIRRSLVQAAYCQREDGLAAGLYPGQNTYLSSYALLWISGCLRYFQHTGDRQLLIEMHDTAVKTLSFFMSGLTSRGVYKLDVWDFIDWGHFVEDSEINVSLNLLIVGALRDLITWELELGMIELANERQKQKESHEQIIHDCYLTAEGLLAQAVPAVGENKPEKLQTGYHATVLGLWLDLFDSDVKEKAVEYVKLHILNCFPNHAEAPRLAHPDANHARLITPYFMHFALHALLEAGEVDYVLEQYKACWGWMIEQGATTLLEVFDTRWSHCHAWSGCPAWQLSRHVLGLSPDESGYPSQFNWYPKTSNLEFAEGKLPIANTDALIEIQWKKIGSEWSYKLLCEQPLLIKLTDKLKIKEMVVDGDLRISIDVVEVHVKSSLTLLFS